MREPASYEEVGLEGAEMPNAYLRSAIDYLTQDNWEGIQRWNDERQWVHSWGETQLAAWRAARLETSEEWWGDGVVLSTTPDVLTLPNWEEIMNYSEMTKWQVGSASSFGGGDRKWDYDVRYNPGQNTELLRHAAQIEAEMILEVREVVLAFVEGLQRGELRWVPDPDSPLTQERADEMVQIIDDDFNKELIRTQKASLRLMENTTSAQRLALAQRISATLRSEDSIMEEAEERLGRVELEPEVPFLGVDFI